MTTTPGPLHCYPDCSCRREERPMTGPDHPHDGYAYDGCKCTCCRNVRALAGKAEARADVDVPAGTRLILASENLLEQWGTRDNEGHAITAAWGEQRPEGWYEPQFTVHYDQPLEARADVDGLVARLRAAVKDQDISEGYVITQEDRGWQQAIRHVLSLIDALLAGGKAEAPE